ncbi:hypothetical protein BDE36_3632 [Arcticibacter tournemirensis]|nr:hypothetical protein [Arcticibacter tournemirensis]TQM51839.1 hypothetical protein BDE36_3632 [Arcticibacter tournemirensis]
MKGKQPVDSCFPFVIEDTTRKQLFEKEPDILIAIVLNKGLFS